MSFFNVRHMGSILYLTRHYDESLEYLNKAHEMEPELQGFTQSWITNDYEMKGLYDDAVMSDLWFYSAPRGFGAGIAMARPHADGLSRRRTNGLLESADQAFRSE